MAGAAFPVPARRRPVFFGCSLGNSPARPEELRSPPSNGVERHDKVLGFVARGFGYLVCGAVVLGVICAVLGGMAVLVASQ